MRKLTVFCVILLLFLQVFSGVAVYGAASEGNSIVISGYSIGSQNIYEGNQFKIMLNCKNSSTTDDLTDVYIEIGSTSSFYGYPSNAFKAYDGVLDNDGSSHYTNEIDLVYKGSGKELNVTLKYKIASVDYFETFTVYIKEARPTDNTPPTPIDTSRYAPKLGTASGNNIPAIVAGTSQTVTFPVKNSSTYQARNIAMTLKMADETKTPLVFENFDLRQTVDQINGNETKPVAFNIKILKSAPEGIYALKLNYQFQSLFNDNFESSETVYIRVQNDNINPRLTVDSIAVKQGATSADAVSLELKVKNIGNLPAKDIKITLRGLKSGGFTTYNSTDVKYMNRIAGNSTGTVSYQLLMPAAAVAGSNELSVKMDYRDEAGTAYSEENQIFVPAGEGTDTKPAIAFDKIVSPQEVLAANKDFEIRLDLKNNGGAAARNIKVSLTTDKEIVTKSLSPVYIDKLDAKAGKTVSFKMFATDEAVTKNYPLAVNIEYEDIFGVKYSASQYIGVYIENGSGKTVPRIIVDKYSLNPLSVKAGEDFKLKMSFLNTSSIANVSNIKVTVASDDGTFTPTDSGNTFYLDGIPTKESVERELLLHVKPDAEQKSYILSVNFEYEDDRGNPYTSKETISVRVLQNPRLVTGEISLPPETYTGQPLSIYIDFYNMGKSTLYNMMVKAEGDFQGQNLSYYVGNFESGRTDSFDASIIPAAPGNMKGNIVFSFEDANGKITEIRKEFSVNVMEMVQQGPALDGNGMPIDKGVGMPGAAPEKKTGILIYIIPAVVVIAAVVTFIMLRKRHVRRKEMSLDE